MRIVLTGGVTGGHIYPAIAIGDRFRAADPECEIIYIASGEPLEKEIITGAGYELFEVQSEPFYRNNIFRMAGTLSKTMKGRSEARRIMKDFNPDAIISTGSYVSVPVVLAGASLGTKVYLHEQNGFPGVSNKFLAKYANRVFLGFESAEKYFADKDRVVYSGNPVRQEFSGRDRSEDRSDLGIPEDDYVIMVFGGSLGSETTNVIGESIARKYAGEEGITVIWGTGKDYYDEIHKRLEEEEFNPANVRIMPYISDMPQMLSACNLSVSRSGALSVAETTMAGRIAVFVPSPNVTEDHQYYNAKAVADAGGAFIVREDGNAGQTAEEVQTIIEEIRANEDLQKKMEDACRSLAPVEATDIIYTEIMEDFPQKNKTDSEDDSEDADKNGEHSEEEPITETEEERTDEEESGTETEEETTVEEPETETDEETEPETEGETVTAAEERDPEPEAGSESRAVELSDEDKEIVERIRLRKAATRKKRARQQRRLFISLFLIILAIAAFILSFTSLFTVDLIEVRGNTTFSAEEIISMAHASPGKNIIYHPDKDSIKENLELNPYIKKAEVSRKLPSTLVITVSERQQMMALKYDDDYLLLDREGVLLQKSHSKPKLTLVEGNIITRIKLGEQLGTKNDELIDKTVKLIQMMADSDLYYVKVDISNLRDVKAYVYDTLVVKTDYDTLMRNMENGRLHKVLDKLFEDSIKRGTITFVDKDTASFMPTF